MNLACSGIIKFIALATLLFTAASTFAASPKVMLYSSDSTKWGKEKVYLSVGCPSSLDAKTTLTDNDILLTTVDDYGWYVLPSDAVTKVKAAGSFCFFRGTKKKTPVYQRDAEGNVEYNELNRPIVVDSVEAYTIFSETFNSDEISSSVDTYFHMKQVLLPKNDIEGSAFYAEASYPSIFYQKPSNWVYTYLVFKQYDYTFALQSRDIKDGWQKISTDSLRYALFRYNRVRVDSSEGMVYNSMTQVYEKGQVYKYDTVSVDTIYRKLTERFLLNSNGGKCTGRHVGDGITYVETYNHAGMISDVCISDDMTMFDVSKNKGTDSVYIFANPYDTTKTVVRVGAPDIKIVHVLPPQNEEWLGLNPILSGTKDFKYKIDMDHCGWFRFELFEEDLSKPFVFKSEHSDKLKFGIDGTDKAFDLNALFKKYGTNELFVVADDLDNHVFNAYPEDYEGVCSISLTGIVYDTDAKLHPAFSCYSEGGEGCQMGAQSINSVKAVEAINNCIGITTGVVEETLGKNNKPVLSADGKKCFISDDLFNQLFTPTENVNEVSCTDIQLSKNYYGLWEFTSDFYMSPGVNVMGGYYPVEEADDSKIVVGYPVPDARRRRTAEGPVFVAPVFSAIDEEEHVMKMNLMCNGPAWDKGVDCSGSFADGDETTMRMQNAIGESSACVFGWSCPERAPMGWPLFSTTTSEKTVGYVNPSGISAINYTYRWKGIRNQHFCFESHASFVYKKGQRFGVRGDDDIWVFIAGKLAIDLGGTHLAAPGYADLDVITDANGDPLVEGKSYNLDFFFCDRRTTMSNMNIYSNIYLKQNKSSMAPCGDLLPDEDPGVEQSSSSSANVDVEGSSSSSVKGDVEGESSSSVKGDVEGSSSSSVKGDVEGGSSSSVKGDVEGGSSSSVKGDVEGGSSSSVKGDVEVGSSSSVKGDVEGESSSSVNGDEEGDSSSSEDKDAIAWKNGGAVNLNVQGRNIVLNGTMAGSRAVLMDMQGRVVKIFAISGTTAVLPVERSGSYILKYNRYIKLVNIK